MMRNPQITRDRHGILEVVECDPAFVCTRDSLEYLIRLHNEMVEQRNLLATALEACREDSCELLGERSWWKDEERADFSERYDATSENIVRANEALDALSLHSASTAPSKQDGSNPPPCRGSRCPETP